MTVEREHYNGQDFEIHQGEHTTVYRSEDTSTVIVAHSNGMDSELTVGIVNGTSSHTIYYTPNQAIVDSDHIHYCLLETALSHGAQQ